jgi:DNA oxidative demethylase
MSLELSVIEFSIKVIKVKILKPRRDFIIVEDYFSPQQAAGWLQMILNLGLDPIRGFHHPDLRPNRFHAAPKYPVKKYMCLGLYWNPLDYQYHELMAPHQSRPHEFPSQLAHLSQLLLTNYYPWNNYLPEVALVNYYTQNSSMGLHVDKDEKDHRAPVIGLNFGSTCRFFYETEEAKVLELKIPGNSIYIFGASARLMRHGVGTVYKNTLAPGSEAFLKNKERLNITIRQVSQAPD